MLDPNYAAPYNNRGFANRKLGRYPTALIDYDEAIRGENPTKTD